MRQFLDCFTHRDLRRRRQKVGWQDGISFESSGENREYKDGIYFKVFDPQFFLDHQGERLRFSQDGTDFVDTGLRLTRPASKAKKGSRKDAASLPLQTDVLK